jgi:hypothetical protein
MAVKRGERPSINESDLINAPEDFLVLMRKCWETNPKSRPTFNEVLEELMEILDNNGRRGNGQTPTCSREMKNKKMKTNEYLTATDGTVFTLQSAK